MVSYDMLDDVIENFILDYDGGVLEEIGFGVLCPASGPEIPTVAVTKSCSRLVMRPTEYLLRGNLKPAYSLCAPAV